MKSPTRLGALAMAAMLTAFSPLANAACNGADINADAPDARYTSATDTVTDLATGLVWKRCAEGLSGATCTGTAFTGDWSQALARVAAVNSGAAGTINAGSTDWRLPNRAELASLVERKCAAPAINSAVFPATPAQSFWSSSPYALIATTSWYVDFNAGDVGAALKTSLKNVRLVRGQ
ncbi:MAG: DUF1566 domain-containing protein [Massilia sp.]